MKWVRDRTGRFHQRPHYLPEEIDDECERLITGFLTKKYGKLEFPVKTDDLTILIEENADLDSYADLSGEPGEVEGVTEFVPGKRPVVRISGSLSSPHWENRLRTTLTHEYGHVHFHRFMFEALDPGAPTLLGPDHNGLTNKCHRENMIGVSERDWMEWQAGYACGSILMPINALLEVVRRFRAEKELPYANLLLNSEHGQELVGMVSSTFQTSRDAARVRLLKKGILAEATLHTTGDLF